MPRVFRLRSFWLFSILATFVMPLPAGAALLEATSAWVGRFTFMVLAGLVAWGVTLRSPLWTGWLVGAVTTMALFGAYAKRTDDPRRGLSHPTSQVAEQLPQRPRATPDATRLAVEDSDNRAFTTSTSEFEVTFAGTPTVTPSTVVGIDGTEVEIQTAEHLGLYGFQRAEIIAITPSLSKDVDRTAAFETLRAYATHNGLAGLEMRWKESHLGKEAWLRGTKSLDRDGAPTPVTFQVRYIYGTTTLLIQYVGGASAHYPFEGANEFLASVRRLPDPS